MSIFMNDQPGGPGQFGRIFAPDQQWLKSHPAEAILDPDLPIIDTHHHLWDPPGNRYLLDELLADLQSGHNVVSTVFVECNAMYRHKGPVEMQPVGETEFVAGIAAMSDSGNYGPTRIAQGIVGFADLKLGDRVRPVLDAHIEAGGGRFRGIRYATAWNASDIIGNSHSAIGPDNLRHPDIRGGLKQLSSLGLSFDAWVFHNQLADVVDIAAAFPDLNIIAGHVGGPLGYGPYLGKRDEVFASWKASVTELAKRPNVSMKLGGMLMRLGSFDYLARPAPLSSSELAAHWRPYMEICIELFGADRCLFESNFPVEKMGTSYALLWNAFKRIAGDASESEKQALFNGTARRVYRLD
ncbi:amidohydrolase family protein [Pollutimonas bauzanensis]|uniref:Predicted metal-dependent hydrolase, TIM-barrel fold n=1 Tax=Pollutimonas bauzanensis TaxID=658167 RepID=A0A1M5R0I6_9BURK|nr:amidohydrolase family protein [Pollutimonas bauzanensis]SHH19872.1 Predicted metal-dependent hydrolase, TIM-barrel fold [Pollutimonas bauzanensis]